MDFQPRPQGGQHFQHGSAVSKEVLGRDLANFSLYSDARISAAAEVPTRDTDPVHLPQSVQMAAAATWQEPAHHLHMAQQPAARMVPVPRYGQTDRQQFTLDAPVHPQLQPAEAPTVQEQLGAGRSPTVQTPAPDASAGYTPVQPLTLPMYTRKPSPQPPVVASATSGGTKDKAALSTHVESNGDLSGGADDACPASAGERSPSEKTQDKAATERHTNSKKIPLEKKTKSKARSHKVQRGHRSADAEIQAGEHCQIRDGMQQEKETSALKEGLHKLQRLTRDLKMVTNTKGTVKVKRLARELDDTLKMVLPGTGDLSWQTELDLAMQPLRNENAQLRRCVCCFY